MAPAKSKGRPQIENRVAFNGILWILKSGAPWRFLPSKYGNLRQMKQYHFPFNYAKMFVKRGLPAFFWVTNILAGNYEFFTCCS